MDIRKALLEAVRPHIDEAAKEIEEFASLGCVGAAEDAAFSERFFDEVWSNLKKSRDMQMWLVCVLDAALRAGDLKIQATATVYRDANSDDGLIVGGGEDSEVVVAGYRDEFEGREAPLPDLFVKVAGDRPCVVEVSTKVVA